MIKEQDNTYNYIHMLQCPSQRSGVRKGGNFNPFSNDLADIWLHLVRGTHSLE